MTRDLEGEFLGGMEKYLNVTPAVVIARICLQSRLASHDLPHSPKSFPPSTAADIAFVVDALGVVSMSRILLSRLM